MNVCVKVTRTRTSEVSFRKYSTFSISSCQPASNRSIVMARSIASCLSPAIKYYHFMLLLTIAKLIFYDYDLFLYFLFQLKTFVLTANFKPNCAFCVVDFLLRHGYITPDNGSNWAQMLCLGFEWTKQTILFCLLIEVDYFEIAKGLHSDLLC